MKYFKLTLTFLITFFVGSIIASATGATITVNRNSIEVGQSVTATIRVTGAAGWDLNVTSAGSTPGCNQRLLGESGNGQDVTRTFTVTCASSSTGIINISFSGILAPAAGGTRSVSGNVSVNVTPVTPRSNNNFLRSLEVTGFELSPAFDRNTLEYSVVVPFGTESINIAATRDDNTATVRGAGEVTLEEGLNRVEVIVTAQNGSERRYIINVTVEEQDPIIVNINNRELIIVRNLDDLPTPSPAFSATTIEIDGEEIPGFYSELLNMLLVGLRNEDGEISLFIKENGEYKPFIELNFNGVFFIPMNTDIIPARHTLGTLMVQGVELTVFRLNDTSSFVLIYGINSLTGNQGFYVLDKDENTIQRHNYEEINDIQRQNRIYLYTSIGLAVLLLISFILLIRSARKRTKLIQRMMESTKEKIKKNKKEETKDKKVEKK